MATEVLPPQRDQQPYLDIGLITVTWANGAMTLGTASLVGRNDILTAGHNVFNPDRGGWATGFEFYFAADYNSASDEFEDVGFHAVYSRWTAIAWPSDLYSDPDNTTNNPSESESDVALIGIDAPIGDTLGWLGMSAGHDTRTDAVAVGYPAGAPGMMTEAVRVDPDPFWSIYTSDHDVLGPGSSGGPLLVGDTIIGVKSTAAWWADIGLVWDDLIAELSVNDELLGPSASQPQILTGTADDDVLNGSNGNDTFRGLAGNDMLSGGGGTDVAIFSSNRTDYTIARTGSAYSVTGPDGSDTLLDIERLQFPDRNVALDLAAGEAGGNTVRIIGAAYDAPAIRQHPDWVRLGLELFDAGATLSQVCAQVAASLGLSNTAFVSTLYQNVAGVAPSPAELSYFVGLLQGSGGTLTQGDLLQLAASLPSNEINIDLVGLQATGVDFF